MRESKQTDYTGDRVLCGLTDETAKQIYQHNAIVETEKVSNLETLKIQEEKKQKVTQARTKWLSIFGTPGEEPALSVKKAQGTPLALSFYSSGGFELALWIHSLLL